MSLTSSSATQIQITSVVAVLLCCVTVNTGCGPEQEPSASSTVQTDAQDQSTLDACRMRLEGVARRFRPDSLSAINDLTSSVGALNAWLVECAAQELKTLSVSEANLAYLNPAAQRSVSAPRFSVRDVIYVRDSLIVSRLAQAIVERSNSPHDLEFSQVLSLFRWVGNNISLEGTAAAGTSMGFLDTLLTGQGTVRSRVWLLAALLRQLQIDVVILLPNDAREDPEDDSEFLIAACVNDKLVLFDPLTWLPIPSADDDSVQINNPAGADYLATNDRWNLPQVRIVAETSALCPRMLVLQEQLPAKLSAILYEEISGGTSDIRPLIERLVSSAPEIILADRFEWWDWPDQQATAAMALDESQQRTRDQQMKSFEAPYNRDPLDLGTDFNEILSDPSLTSEQREALWQQKWKMEIAKIRELEKERDLKKLFGRPSDYLLKIRLEQVEGSSDRRIIQQLQRIRNACIDDAIRFTVPLSVDHTGQKSIPIPESLQKVNLAATGNSLYWTGLCQMDRSQSGTAVSAFRNYRRQYPDGKWFYPSLMNQALSEMAQGRYDAAFATLSEADHMANPERRRVVLMLERLQAAIERETPSAESIPDADAKVAPSEPPAVDQPSLDSPDSADDAV
ncbi:MAG: hypothetical protein MK102_07950 [Fuerstiella sp.]|nr:hypothetical protein [Fuerstiella sp.]